MIMGYVWIAAAAVFCIVESMTFQFISIWFVGGSIAGLIAYMLGADIAMQITVAVVVSAVLLAIWRPFAKRLLKKTKVNTNADSVIGKKIVLTKAVNDFGENGEAKVNGSFWTVNSADGEGIGEGETVVVEAIEGVKLIVRK